MCRVNPKKIRQPRNYEHLWILNPTPDEIRPYRILIKKTQKTSPQYNASKNEILIAKSPISYIVNAILSKDTSFYNLSASNSKEYSEIRNSAKTNEELAIKLYSSSDNKYINNYLRTRQLIVEDRDDEIYNEDELRSWIYCLHSALRHFRNNVKNNLIVYRGVNLKLPGNIRVGSKFFLREFCSTSVKEKVEEQFASDGTLFIIKIKNNGINQNENYCLNIREYSKFRDEDEILITCHCYFSVTCIQKRAYNHVYGVHFDKVYLDCEGYKFD
jgi:hypothetical protein